MYTLDTISKDAAVIITGLAADCPEIIRQRFLDLGFVNGATVEIFNISPLGDPVAYLIHSTVISIRKQDAKYIIVKEKEAPVPLKTSDNE